ncbi:MAG TPA: inorganic phosphate transporter [Bacilli bacterium]
MLDGMALIVLIVILALLFDFTNGWNDSANAIATIIATRGLKPIYAVLLAAVLNLVGAFAFTAVAKMIGGGIIKSEGITLAVVVAILVGGIIWNTGMTLIGMPISASHALIGGIIGAGVAHGGFQLIIASGVYKVLLAMLFSPVIGAFLSFLLMKIFNFIFANYSPSKVKKLFRRLQLLSVSWLAFSHGTSDAQKSMGIIMMGLVAGGYVASMDEPIPFWVILACGLAMALGTAIGGKKVITTMGMRLSKLEPINGFSAEVATSLILTFVARIGIPVSSTHTITGSVIGVGLANRVNSVRWGLAGKIVYAWVFTLPGTAIISFLVYKLLQLFGLY